MSVPTASELTGKKCVPCEGGVPRIEGAALAPYLASVPHWQTTADGLRIRREWTAKHFMAAMDFLNKVAELAEAEGHHPDLHLAGYRNLAIEIWTHAIGGLSENDFILAAKIDQIPIKTRTA